MYNNLKILNKTSLTCPYCNHMLFIAKTNDDTYTDSFFYCDKCKTEIEGEDIYDIENKKKEHRDKNKFDIT